MASKTDEAVMWTSDAIKVISCYDVPRYKRENPRICVNCDYWVRKYRDVYGKCKCNGIYVPNKNMYTNYYETCGYCSLLNNIINKEELNE